MQDPRLAGGSHRGFDQGVRSGGSIRGFDQGGDQGGDQGFGTRQVCPTSSQGARKDSGDPGPPQGIRMNCPGDLQTASEAPRARLIPAGPGGFAAIGRRLSEATPPERIPSPSILKGCQQDALPKVSAGCLRWTGCDASGIGAEAHGWTPPPLRGFGSKGITVIDQNDREEFQFLELSRRFMRKPWARRHTRGNPNKYFRLAFAREIRYSERGATGLAEFPVSGSPVLRVPAS